MSTHSEPRKDEDDYINDYLRNNRTEKDAERDVQRDDVERDVEQERGQEDGDGRIAKVGIRDRMKHFTWAWFTSTMSTGGLAIALAETPRRFDGEYFPAQNLGCGINYRATCYSNVL
jgi:hypothetical protein